MVTEALRANGYYTAASGKWHLGNEVRDRFDTISVGRPSGAEKWIQTLAQRPKEKPFFMWLASFDPHRPYQDDTIPVPHTPGDVIVPPMMPDVPEVRKDLAMYYDEIARLDGFVGEVMTELERQGITDNTCVVFLSDNGRPFPRCKTTLYDSGVRTPFIIRFPKMVAAGSTCDSVLSTVDISPTFLELAGCDTPKTMQGQSFVKLLSDPKANYRTWAFAEHNWHDYTARERSVRSERYLYVRNEYPDLPRTPPADAVKSITFQKMVAMYNAGELTPTQADSFLTPRPSEELYDTQADPYNLHNLIDDPKYADILAQHRTALDHWKRDTEDTAPTQRRPDEFDRTTGQRLRK
jgi:arylsulfatase A-like enzyme